MNHPLGVLFESQGLRLTQPRKVIFDILNKSHEPLRMSQIVEQAHGQLDRASVYRTIALFEQIGVVHRINIGWKYKIELGDQFMEHHHHLVCLRCHKVIPINEDELERLIRVASEKHHFRPVEHQVEIQGYCENCQKLMK